MTNYQLKADIPCVGNIPERRPYDAQVRPESIIDLNFKRTPSEKIPGLIAFARSYNALGSSFILKNGYGYAIDALTAAGVRFRMEEPVLNTKRGLPG